MFLNVESGSTLCHMPRTVLPLPGGGVDDAEELVVADGLGVEDVGDGLAALVLVGLLQCGPHPGLARPCWPQQEHGVPHVEQLHQLHALGEDRDCWFIQGSQ